MKISGIYKIESKVKPERIYIGSALELKKRWRTHLWMLNNRRHHSNSLQNHFNKYGREDLTFTIIELCLSENLLTREQFYLNTIEPCFNTCKIAGSIMGVTFSEEAKYKMRHKIISNETKCKLREASLRNGNRPPSNKGKPKSEDTKQKMRGNKNACGNVRSTEKNQEHSEFMTGRKHALGKHWTLSEEARNNMKLAWTKRKLVKSK